MTKYMQLLDIEFDLIYHQTIGKKKYYLTYNTIYAGISHNIRKKIVDQMKLYVFTIIKKNIQERPIVKEWFKSFDDITVDYQIHIQLNFITKTSNWDLDNRGSLWIKIICDVLKEMIGKDDSVKFINKIEFVWQERKGKLAEISEEDYIRLHIFQTKEVNENND